MLDREKNNSSNDYQIDLAVFQGPLDLLLYLIKKEEVDIYDIPIAKITRQYLKYIEMMTKLNLEIAGEFILMAATLISIKTRLLLPGNPDDAEETDPREELIMALIEYKKYTQAGDILKDRAIIEERNFVPLNPISKINEKLDLQPASTLYDLLSAFSDVLKAKQVESFHQVETEEISIEDRINYIMLYLKEREYATFQELFSDLPKKIVAVVTFMALLELARSKRIAIHQAKPFSELRIYRGEDYEGVPLDINMMNVVTVE